MMNNDENVPPEEEQREHPASRRLFVALLNDKKGIYPVISAQQFSVKGAVARGHATIKVRGPRTRCPKSVKL
jgi:hypothetical protein